MLISQELHVFLNFKLGQGILRRTDIFIRQSIIDYIVTQLLFLVASDKIYNLHYYKKLLSIYDTCSSIKVYKI